MDDSGVGIGLSKSGEVASRLVTVRAVPKLLYLQYLRSNPRRRRRLRDGCLRSALLTRSYALLYNVFAFNV